MSLLEKDKIMLQHRFTEYQRKADQEAEKRRNLENEGKDNEELLASDWDALQLKYCIIAQQGSDGSECFEFWHGSITW